MIANKPAGTAAEFRTGWLLLIAAMLGCGLGVSSLPLYTAGVFFPHLEAEFGWTRAELSGAVLAFTLSLAAASPVVGRVVDGLGVRRAAALSILAAVGIYGLLALFLSGIAYFYAAHVLIAALGAAAAPVAYTRIVTNHFTNARGLALGIALLGPSLAATLGPTAVTWAITSGGWRGGYLLLAALIGAMLPFLLLLRDERTAAPVTGVASDVSNWFEGRRRRVFVLMLAAFGLFSLGIGGLIVHLIPMLTDAGMSASQAAATAGLIGLSGIAGRLAGGAAADHIFAPYILLAVALAASAGCLTLAISGTAFAAIAAIAIGFSLGAEADLMGYLVSRYFAKAAYGRVFGWLYAVFIAGVGLSPLLLGVAFDRFGDYVVALWTCAALLLAAAVLFVRLPAFEDQS